MITASFAFRNNAPNSASAADDMTALIIVDVVNIAPLFGAELLLIGRNVLLRGFVLFSRLRIPHCCELGESCRLHCMLLLLPLALRDNLIIALPLLWFSL